MLVKSARDMLSTHEGRGETQWKNLGSATSENALDAFRINVDAWKWMQMWSGIWSVGQTKRTIAANGRKTAWWMWGCRLADQGLFHLNKDLRLKRHPRMTKKWIKIVRMCIAQHKKEKKRGFVKQRKITRYFGRRKKAIINGNGLQTCEANEQSVEVEMPPDRRLKDTGWGGKQIWPQPGIIDP